MNLVKEKDMDSREIQKATRLDEATIIFVLKQQLEIGTIKIKSNNKYTLSK